MMNALNLHACFPFKCSKISDKGWQRKTLSLCPAWIQPGSVLHDAPRSFCGWPILCRFQGNPGLTRPAGRYERFDRSNVYQSIEQTGAIRSIPFSHGGPPFHSGACFEVRRGGAYVPPGLLLAPSNMPSLTKLDPVALRTVTHLLSTPFRRILAAFASLSLFRNRAGSSIIQKRKALMIPSSARAI
jgi:hypothetical protein